MPDVKAQIDRHFPTLSEAYNQLPTSAFKVVQIPSESPVFSIGDACSNYMLVTSGTVRVYMLTRSGKQLLLYRVAAGQSCVITTSCLLGCAKYPTFAKTETNVEALVLSQEHFKQGLDKCHEFRNFVFDGLGQRLADVMARLETINFSSVDNRLAEALLSYQQDNKLDKVTHSQLSEEIGTAREVVSRHLKKYESKNIIKLSRGAIVIINQQKLLALCD